jgi:hypothetical protein
VLERPEARRIEVGDRVPADVQQSYAPKQDVSRRIDRIEANLERSDRQRESKLLNVAGCPAEWKTK